MAYSIRTSVAPDGEVHPLVVGADGLPIWWPNLWLLTAHRSRGAAYGTLATYGTFLCRLYVWAEDRGIPLDQRFLDRKWLEPWLLDSLADGLSVQVRGLKPAKPGRKHPGNIEQFLAPKVSEAPLVANETIATRLNIVADYLRWLGMEGVNRAPFAAKETHKGFLDEMIQKFVDKVPINHGHNKGSGRTYDRDGVLRMLEVTLPGHPENPFRSPETQLRNHLIVMMLFTFGLRIGELGALKAKDIDERARVLAVARRPDDPEDPRGRYAMRQKTRARVMILELADLIKTYKSKVRNRHDQALNHPYLFVSEQDGRPMSMAALEKVFRELRENVAGLPGKLTPHYLRHAWNYEFSKVCEAKGIPRDEAEQLRKYLMGWKMNSSMHKLYDQPYIQERANECSLETQKRMFVISQEAQAAFDRMKNLANKTKGQGGTRV
jgi:integrase